MLHEYLCGNVFRVYLNGGKVHDVPTPASGAYP